MTVLVADRRRPAAVAARSEAPGFWRRAFDRFLDARQRTSDRVLAAYLRDRPILRERLAAAGGGERRDFTAPSRA